MTDPKLGASCNVMLVSSDPCEAIENRLLASGCLIVRVTKGAAAVQQAQRESFDVAFIVFTGKRMDVVETALNLRDINRALRIVVVRSSEAGAAGEPLSQILIPGVEVVMPQRMTEFIECRAQQPSKLSEP